jgi:hypothetical protein
VNFEHCRKVKTVKYIVMYSKICSVYLFSGALSELLFVLHKDALFHLLLAIMLSIIMARVIILSGVIPSVIVLIIMLCEQLVLVQRRTFYRRHDSKNDNLHNDIQNNDI